ncbi:gluconolactonase precursor [Rhodopirellula baltica SH28]|uniref:Gluconolactonase n=2 Tax=Rhodopirellula baltica TaxID=265606 RepID=K5EBY2_RHOBT|nr:gluconolactonase precursor [Rhodopirellula baltica SH28]
MDYEFMKETKLKVRLRSWYRLAKLGLAMGVTWGSASAVVGEENDYVSPRATSVFAGTPMLLQEHGAGEGPAWHSEKGLFTSGEGNINLRSLNGETSVYQTDSGSNGLMFDREGRLVVCEAVRRRIVRLELDGSKTVLTDGFDGMKFNQPNDLSIDSVGRIYFTDPQYGDRSNMELVDESGKHVEGVYRIDPDGTVSRIIAHEVDRPNGLVVTADDRSLFVADNNNGLGGARKLWRFDLKANGSVDLSSQTLVHDWGTTRGPDGMKLDQQGRLYVAAGLNEPHLPQETAEQPTAGIYVFSQEGKLLDYLRIPRDETTNCAFGGDDLKTLFVTAGGTLWSVQTVAAGAPVFPSRSSK